MGDTVQFRKIDDIVQAYRSRGVARFCIKQRSQMLFTYVGSDMEEGEICLKDFLDLLYRAESIGIYTLCIFEEVEKNNRITNKTPYDGSFNFRFSEFGEERVYGSNNRALESKIAALEVMVQRLLTEKENDAEDDPIERTMGTINALMANPVIGNIIGTVAERLLAALMPNANEQPKIEHAQNNVLKQAI